VLNCIRSVINKIKGVDTTLENELRALEKEYVALLKQKPVKTDNVQKQSYSAQGKSARKGAETNDGKKTLSKYTKAQYNNFGWAMYDNIITPKMNNMLTSKLYELSKQNVYFNKTSDGQYIIPIGEDYGQYDVLVYTNNDPVNPKISQVIKLSEFADEYLKESVWRELLSEKNITERAIERKIAYVRTVYGEKSIIRYVLQDSPSFQEYEYATNEGAFSGQDSGRNGKRFDLGSTDTEGERDRSGDIKGNLKSSYSKVDTEGNTLSEAQQEYFKDSAVRDTEGRLIPVYHGTEKGGFTVFILFLRRLHIVINFSKITVPSTVSSLFCPKHILSGCHCTPKIGKNLCSYASTYLSSQSAVA
jgi:hypothetical protein